MTPPDRSSWARALSDPAAFDDEQARLGHVWTLLGITSDIPKDGDWFRTTLGGRSVFVQRFGESLRGFENICAHRGFPLRRSDTGNGVIRCGFHNWQYDKDGRALGIPLCREMFGVTPRELGARLNPIEVAVCGAFIFARFPGATNTLEQFLGGGFAILQAMSAQNSAPIYVTRDVAANWKLCFHITLEDYHIVAVHPKTVGSGGYMKEAVVNYHRFGQHSACFETETVDAMAEQCRDKQYRPSEYRIFQFFPNLLVSHYYAARSWWVAIQLYVPIACDRSQLRAWSFPAPFPPHDKDWRDRLLRQVAAPYVRLGVRYQWPKIMDEDNAVCEQWQSVARQIKVWPFLGKHEERIAWFEDAYAEALAAKPVP